MVRISERQAFALDMKLRQMATAFIYRDSQLLLMKKQQSRLQQGEFWSGLGGHMEEHEINSPYEACVREIFEESGITESELTNMALRYILIRRKDKEIRQQYVFFAQTSRQETVSSDEGELFWVDEDQVLNQTFSRIVKSMLEHYFLHRDHKEIVIGAITVQENEEPVVQWMELKDPEVF